MASEVIMRQATSKANAAASGVIIGNMAVPLTGYQNRHQSPCEPPAMRQTTSRTVRATRPSGNGKLGQFGGLSNFRLGKSSRSFLFHQQIADLIWPWMTGLAILPLRRV
jgi:hypothetical protein